MSVVEEFINMITSQRAFEANSKVVKAADEMYQTHKQSHDMKWTPILFFAAGALALLAAFQSPLRPMIPAAPRPGRRGPWFAPRRRTSNTATKWRSGS